MKGLLNSFATKYFKKDEIETEDDDEILSEDIYQDLRLGWLDNYYAKTNKDFEELSINKGK